MKVVAVALAAFATGAIGGALTRSRPELPSARPAAERRFERNVKAGQGVELSRPGQPPSARVMPRFMCGEVEKLTERQRGLQMVLEIVPPESLQKQLFMIVWADAMLERRALELLRSLTDARDLDLFIDLKLLGFISDPAVRDEVMAWMRSETNPEQRRRLARIVGSFAQHRDFKPLAVELLADPDLEVVDGALGEYGMPIGYESLETQSRVAGLLRSVASPGKPESLRLKALRSLRNVCDETTVRFLMDVASRDRSEQAAVAAIGSFPYSMEFLSYSRPLAIETFRFLYALALDSSKSPRVRNAAAWAAELNDDPIDDADRILSPEEMEQLQRVKAATREE